MRPPESAGLKVVAHQLVLLPQVQLAVDDDRVRPALAFLVAGRHRTFELVSLLSRRDESQQTVLISEQEVVADESDGRGAAAALHANPSAPLHLAGLPFEADREAVVVAMPG